MDIKLKSRNSLQWFQDDRLTIENQAEYLSKLYTFHENINNNHQKFKYLKEKAIFRNKSLQVPQKNDLVKVNQHSSLKLKNQYISNSSSSFFKNPNLAPLSISNSQQQQQQQQNQNGFKNEIYDKLDLNRESAFTSSSAMSLSTSTSSNNTTNSKQNKNDFETQKKNNNLESISIGGKQLLDNPHQHIHSYPIIANAKIEYPHRLKPVDTESVNRIKKMLNLDNQNNNNNNNDDQHQIHKQITNNTNSSINTTNNNLVNLKQRLRESRIRHSLKTNSILENNISNNLFIQTSRSLNKIDDSDENLITKSKPKLPQIRSFKKSDSEDSYSQQRRNSKLTDDSYNYIQMNVPPSSPLSISNNNKNQQHQHHDDKCVLCELSETKSVKKEFQPLITIVTTSKPISQIKNQNTFQYMPFKNQLKNPNEFFYKQNSFRNYKSPAPSPEILI